MKKQKIVLLLYEEEIVSNITEKIPYSSIKLSESKTIFYFLVYSKNSTFLENHKSLKFSDPIENEEIQNLKFILKSDQITQSMNFMKHTEISDNIGHSFNTLSKLKEHFDIEVPPLSMLLQYNEYTNKPYSVNNFKLAALRYELVQTKSQIIKDSENFIQFKEKNRSHLLTSEMIISANIVDFELKISVEFLTTKSLGGIDSIQNSLEKLNSRTQVGRFFYDSSLKFQFNNDCFSKFETDPRILIKIKKVLAEVYNSIRYVELTLCQPNRLTILHQEPKSVQSLIPRNLKRKEFNCESLIKELEILKKIERNPFLRRRLNVNFINRGRNYLDIEMYYTYLATLEETLKVETIEIADFIWELIENLIEVGLKLKKFQFHLKDFAWVDEKLVFTHNKHLKSILELTNLPTGNELTSCDTEIFRKPFVGPKIINREKAEERKNEECFRKSDNIENSKCRNFSTNAYLCGFGNVKLSKVELLKAECHDKLLETMIKTINSDDKVRSLEVPFPDYSNYISMQLSKPSISSILVLWMQCCGKGIIRYLGWVSSTEGTLILSQPYTSFSVDTPNIFLSASSLLSFISSVLQLIKSLQSRRANFYCFDMDSLVFENSNLKFLVKPGSEINDFYKSPEVAKGRPTSKSIVFSFGRFLQIMILGYLEQSIEWFDLKFKCLPESFQKNNQKIMKIIQRCTTISCLQRASIDEISLPGTLNF